MSNPKASSELSSARGRRFAAWALPLAAALLVFLVAVPTLFTQEAVIYPLSGDALTYHDLATRLAQWMGDPGDWGRILGGDLAPQEIREWGLGDWVFQQLPTYAFTLGAAYSVFGATDTTGRLVSVLFFALAAALLVIWTRRHFGPWPAALAGAVFALWPANQYYGIAIMTELPVTCLLLAALVVLESTRNRGAFKVILGGLLLGLAAYAKITLLYLPVVLLIADCWLYRTQGRSWARALRFTGLRVAGVLVVVLCWHGFLAAAGVPYNPSKDEGETQLWLYRGSVLSDRGFETLGPGTAISPEMMQVQSEHPEYGKTEGYWACFRQVVTQNPTGWLALVAAKLGWFFRIPAGNGIDIPTWLGDLPPPWRVQLGLLILAVLGILRALARKPAALWVLIPVLWMAAGHAITHLVTRYAIPSMALLTPFAAWGAVTVVEACIPPAKLGRLGSTLAGWWRDQNRRQRATAVLVFPLFPAFMAWGHAASNPDPDEFSLRLEKAGDMVVQRVEITDTDNWNGYAAVEIAVDMLPSLDLDADLHLYVNDRLAFAYNGRLSNPRETFLLDSVIFEKRHDRLLKELNRHLEGFVRHRYPDTGLEYYRQWYRAPIPREWLGTGRVEIKLVMEEHRSGYVEVFGDDRVVIHPEGGVDLAMPGFLENAYEVSTYQFRMFNVQRREADFRLTRPYRLTSRHHGAGLIPAGESVQLEPSAKPVLRMRIRAKYPGQLVLAKGPDGVARYQRVIEPRPTDVILTPYQSQIFLRQRAQSASGWVVW